ncbi:sugar ABC transporter permease [Thermanaerothrix daxensis]|uniref:Sugar ABC transporter permease n=1 Tax=Thermanaerothrix daxensis TaxID=869279 RepID=A0A0P6YKW8_9CHLR|nr:ABC transporter permease [Thermanaerothrix daxensis]KPL83193.1 sugar ABC transporter permease [Thermanaerothrix daxensis]
MKRRISPTLIALALAVVLFFVGGLIQPGFTSFELAMNILRLAAFLGIVAAGQTLVIISGGEGIDLSVGAMVTLGAIISYGLISKRDDRILIGFLASLGAGMIIGTLNGIGVAYLRIPPLVMTLGMATVIQGLIFAVTQGSLEGGSAPLLSKITTEPLLFGIPGILYIWAAFAGLMWLLLQRTRYGKNLFAIGTNRVTARLSGVNVKATVITTYMLCSTLASFGGFIFLGYYERVFLNLGNPYTLPSIAAVVMGGTVLSGGVGSYWGTMAGSIVLTLITSLLTTLRMEEHLRQIVYGAILLVLLAAYGRQRALRQ